MYQISPTATPAERLQWLKDNKRSIMSTKHWRAIPELVAEMKKVNAEIRKLERREQAITALEATLDKIIAAKAAQPEPHPEQSPAEFALGADNWPDETPLGELYGGE